MAPKRCEYPHEGNGMEWVDVVLPSSHQLKLPEYVHTELVLLIHTVKPEHFGLR